MKIGVTGGAGFIGSNLVDSLIEQGHNVFVMDDLSTGFRHNLNPKAGFHEVDVRDGARLQGIVKAEKPEILIHHAAQMDVRRSVREPGFDASVNIVGTLNLLEAARLNGVRKVNYASTGGAVYGEPTNLPADESTDVNPISHYGVSKHTVEHYLFLYHKLYGLNYTALRYANIYGPRQTPHGEAGVVAIFGNLLLEGKQCTIFGKGDKTRDYVFVGDIVRANLIALTKGDNEIINLGTGVATTDQEVYDACKAAVGANLDPIYGDERLGEVRHISLDATKARRVLGWKAEMAFRDGVKLTIDALSAGRAQ
ncbi:MAG TPA: NAD-dependent epimerase/dehydratase family protein [Armatimonadota bacterium]